MGIFSILLHAAHSHPLEYVRSRELSAFSLFGIDPADTAFLLAALEELDPQFTGIINIKIFIKRFCPNNKYIFNLIWKTYIDILKKRANSTVQETLHLDDALKDIDVLTFTCFLLFLMSIHEHEMSEFVYYLFFIGHHISSLLGRDKEFQPDEEKLKELIKILGKSKIASQKKAMAKSLKLAEANMNDIDPNRFHRSQFHTMDVNLKGPFSKPIIYLQRELKKTLISKAVWVRISSCVNNLRNDIQQGKSRLVDKRDIPGRIEHYKNKGDRKKCRKELAPFVKMFQDFSSYILADENGKTQHKVKKPNSSFFSSFFGWMYIKNKVVPEINNKITITAKEDTADTLDMPSLMHKYRKQLKWTMDEVYDKSDSNRFAAEALLAQVDDEIVSADDIINEHLGIENDDVDSDLDQLQEDEFGDDDFPVEEIPVEEENAMDIAPDAPMLDAPVIEAPVSTAAVSADDKLAT